MPTTISPLRVGGMMRASSPAVWMPSLAALLMLAAAGGCSKAPAKKAKPAAAAAAATEEEGVAEGESEVEGIDPDTAIAVDDDRIEACSPTGWIRASQSKDYLVKYIPGRKKTFPSIVVTAADAPEGMDEVDASNQKELVAAIAASLAETYTKNGKSTLTKKPAAVRLGQHFGATWAAPATIKVDGVKESIDRASYAVVMGGRMYTVEVRAPKGRLDAEGRAAAKAVAAGLAPPATAEEEEAATEPPAEPAAEPKPAAEDAAATKTEPAPVAQ
ncbi:MAG: hypothetical protein ACKOHG_02875 [Planctomycetia bacterium]